MKLEANIAESASNRFLFAWVPCSTVNGFGTECVTGRDAFSGFGLSGSPKVATGKSKNRIKNKGFISVHPLEDYDAGAASTTVLYPCCASSFTALTCVRCAVYAVASAGSLRD